MRSLIFMFVLLQLAFFQFQAHSIGEGNDDFVVEDPDNSEIAVDGLHIDTAAIDIPNMIPPPKPPPGGI